MQTENLDSLKETYSLFPNPSRAVPIGVWSAHTLSTAARCGTHTTQNINHLEGGPASGSKVFGP